MRTVGDWLDEYGASHRNPLNKLLHFLCVPAIVLAVLGLLRSVPTPAAFTALSPWLDWATLAAAAALLYYVLLSLRLARVFIAFVALFALTQALAHASWPLWLSSLVIFVVAWMGQFIGHAVEGKRPSFFKDLQFLLIGPLWLLAAAYRRLSLAY